MRALHAHLHNGVRPVLLEIVVEGREKRLSKLVTGAFRAAGWIEDLPRLDWLKAGQTLRGVATLF